MLSHRTNVLFEEEEWQALAELAKREGVSVGNLLRRAAKMLVETSQQSERYNLEDQKKMYVQVREGVVGYTPQKTHELSFSLSLQEYEHLEQIAKNKKENVSVLIANALRQEYNLPREKSNKELLDEMKAIAKDSFKGATRKEIKEWIEEGRK